MPSERIVVRPGLTQKNLDFLTEYVANGYHANEAYVAVYGCQEQTARANASRVLKKPEAQEYLREVQGERIKAMGITAERVLEELSKMAFASKGDEFYTASTKLKALDLLQKQMGLQNQKIEAKVDNQVNINVKVKDTEEGD